MKKNFLLSIGQKGLSSLQGRGRRTLVLSTMTVLFMGIIAFASIPGANGVIYGCYTNSNGTLRVIDNSTTQCKSNETALNFNQTGPQGPRGLQGETGATGATGAPGTGIEPVFGYFYLQNITAPHPIGVGESVPFDRNGPSSGLFRSSETEFVLRDIGVYEVTWQVSVDEAGQLVLALDGAEIPSTVVGRATGASQIVGNVLIENSVPGSTLSVRNPIGNPVALTLTPLAGGARPATSSLVIKRLK